MFMTYDMTCVYTSIMLHEKCMPDSAQSLPKEIQLHIFYLILNNRASLHQFHTLWGEKKSFNVSFQVYIKFISQWFVQCWCNTGNNFYLCNINAQNLNLISD